jgi:hypothetical protein
VPTYEQTHLNIGLEVNLKFVSAHSLQNFFPYLHILVILRARTIHVATSLQASVCTDLPSDKSSRVGAP